MRRPRTLSGWFWLGMGACAVACVPYAAVRFVEWQIDVQSRGRWDDDHE